MTSLLVGLLLPIPLLAVQEQAPVQPSAAPAPAPETLIVLNKGDDTAALVDPATGTTRAVIPTGVAPHEVAVSPDGSLAVVANYGNDTGGNTLTRIDLRSAQAAGEIDLGVYTRPHGLAFVVPGGRLLVTAESHKALLEVDVAEGKVLRAIGTEQEGSHMVVVAPDAKRAYVSNIGSGSVSVLDLEAGALVQVVPTGAECEGIAIAPDGKTVWASNRKANTVSVIDAETLEVTAQLASSEFPIRVAITPDGALALVSCAKAGEVCVYDAREHRLLGAVAMAFQPVEGDGEHLFGRPFGEVPAPVGILAAPGGSLAYVSDNNSNLIAVVDLSGRKVVGTIAAGNGPDGLAWVHR